MSEVEESTVTNAEAYVLFYSLKDNTAVNFRDEINSKVHNGLYTTITKTTPTTTNNTQFKQVRYVTKEWLVRFHSSVRPGQISNGDVLCEHGNVHIRHTDDIHELVVPLPKHIYDNLVTRFQGGPDLHSLQPCAQCKALATRKKNELETFNRLFGEMSSTEDQDNAVYHLSMSWYDSWYAFVTDKTLNLPGAIDNMELMAEDRDLSADKEDVAYGCISQDMWTFLHDIYGGGPEIVVRRAGVTERPATPTD